MIEQLAEERIMKTKKHINSIYKRKKRKMNDDGMTRQRDLEEDRLFFPIFQSPTEASLSEEIRPRRKGRRRRKDNQSMLFSTTTNKAEAKGGNVLLCWLAFVTAINIAQLICDTSNTWSVFCADLSGKFHKTSRLYFSPAIAFSFAFTFSFSSTSFSMINN